MSKDNIERFRVALSGLSWRPVTELSDTNLAFETFSYMFFELFNTYLPELKKKVNKNKVPLNSFMTPGLMKSRKHKLYLAKAARNGDLVADEKFKNYRNLYNKLIKLSKKMFYEEKINKCKHNKKALFDILYEATGLKSETSENIEKIEIDSKIIYEQESIASNFNTFFSSIGRVTTDQISDSEISHKSYLPPPNPNSMFINPTLAAEVENAIKELPNKRSTDLNDISTYLLKKISAEISVPLSHIFNLSLESGIFPELMKTTKTIPIYKRPDKKPSSKLKMTNYRPISLINGFSKVFEKIVSEKVLNFLIMNKFFYKNQFGFLKNRSTEQLQIKMLNYIIEAFNNNEYVMGIFLDIRKAFDCINHSKLLDKLENLGIRGRVLEWFKDYLSNRVQKVKVGSTWSSNLGLLDIGVLQGSVLGVVLFLIYINDLPTCTTMPTFMFADDSSCMAKHHSLFELETYANEELNKISNWFRSNKMSINSEKTKYMIFHPKYKSVTYQTNLLLRDTSDANKLVLLERITNDSKPVNFIRSLGVLLDENLTFEMHINALSLKLTRALFYINRSKNILGFAARKQLFFSLVHSNLLYCNLIYGSASAKCIKKLHLLQKRAIRIVFNKDFRDHTSELFYQLKVLPLPDLITYKALLFFYDFKSKNLPETFLNEWILNTDRLEFTRYNLRNIGGFFVPQSKYQYLNHFPIHRFPKLWNELRADFKYSLHRSEFIKKLKHYLLERLINPEYEDETTLMTLYNLVE